MRPFWQWLRAEIAPDGLPDPVLAFSAGAFAWVITLRLVAIMIAYAAVLEVGQLMVPGRHSGVPDRVASSTGAVCGSMILAHRRSS